jgi:hypothetical protein
MLYWEVPLEAPDAPGKQGLTLFFVDELGENISRYQQHQP